MERYDGGARRLLRFALAEAEALDSDHTGTEHFLLGAMKDRADEVAQVLERNSLSLEQAREVVNSTSSSETCDRNYSDSMVAVLRQTLAPEIADGAIELKRRKPLTNQAAAALVATTDRASVSSSAVLVEMLRQRGSFASLVVESIGISLDDVISGLLGIAT